MTDKMKLEQARSVFDIICRALDKNNIRYDKDTGALSIEFGVQGSDLIENIKISVDVQRRLVLLISHIPFTVQDDKRIDVAVAVAAINGWLVHGSFDYDVISGTIFFRMTNSYIESYIDEEVYEYMLFCAFSTVDEYNDKLLMISKGNLAIEQFLSELSQS